MSAPDITPPADDSAAIDVLLVDDDETVHYLLARRARRAGATLAYRADGASARRFLQDQDVTLLLLDQRLPDGNGDELLHRLIDDGLPGRTSVCICTSHPPPPDACARIEALGATLRVKADILSGDALAALLADARAPSRG